VAKKTVCPISRSDFAAHARSIPVKIGEEAFTAGVKQFSTGSLGWYLMGKTSVNINGVPVAVQIGMNITIVGSKELPQEAGAPPAVAPAPAAPASAAGEE
jgi:hypothetical protein